MRLRSSSFSLHKHYLAAGIGVRYQRLCWDDLNDEVVCPDRSSEYVNDPEYLRRGIGLFLIGESASARRWSARCV